MRQDKDAEPKNDVQGHIIGKEVEGQDLETISFDPQSNIFPTTSIET